MRRHWQVILAACALACAMWARAGEGAAAAPAHRDARTDDIAGAIATTRSFGFITQWPYLGDYGPPEGIAVDDSGDVFLMNMARVYRYTTRGVYVCDWGSAGSGSETFACASGIATDHAGHVYVLDTCEPCVWKCTNTGVPIAHWGSRGTGPGQFGGGLSGIATDDAGNVYVADMENCRITKFTSNGTYLTQWGSEGTGDGQFVWPSAIAIDRQGHVYVADGGSPRVLKFTTSGVPLATWSLQAYALAVDAGANLYAVTSPQDQIVHLDASGHELDRWGGFGWENGQFISASCAAIQRDGSVLVPDSEIRRVEQFGVADRWRITATAGPHGRIAPDTAVAVAEGTSQAYRVVPDLGYAIGSVLVDGVPAGPSAVHTFSDVHAEHAIDASFVPLVGWPADPLLNLPVAGADGWPRDLHVVSDVAGGAIVAWLDYRIVDGTWTFEVRLQRLDAWGHAQWPGRGVRVHASTGSVGLVKLVADGVGGAIALWLDDTDPVNNWDLFLQRVNAAGETVWTPGGVAVCPDPYNQGGADMVSDGAGGAIVTWSVNVNGAASHLVAQRVDATGASRWGSSGLTYRIHDYVESPLIAPDGDGGAIVTWSEVQSGTDIRAQRLGGDGTLRWNSNGVPVCVVGLNQYPSAIVPDGSGGAIGVWLDMRNSVPDSLHWDNTDFYAQHLDAAGVARWTTGGVGVCTAPGSQRDAVAVGDGSGGVFVGWQDEAVGFDAFVQHLDAAGAPLWPANGLELGAAGRSKWIQALGTDGAGGVVAVWNEAGSTDGVLVAQRLSAGGAPLWRQEGVLLSAARGSREGAVVTSDGFEGAIVGWLDHRDWYGGVYAQRVDRAGVLGGVAATAVPATGQRPALRLDRVAPNPLRAGPLRVRFSLANATPARLELLDVAGRRVGQRELGGFGAARNEVEWGDAAQLAPGLYFVRLVQDRAACTARIVVLR